MMSQSGKGGLPAYGTNPYANSSQGLSTAFNTTNAAFGANEDMLNQPANVYDPAMMGAYGRYNPAMARGSQGYNPAMMRGYGSYRAAMQRDPNAIHQQMEQYRNPHETGVVNSTARRMWESGQQALEQNAADAAAAGAFGGSRHGLVEANTMRDVNRNIGDVTGQLRQQGFQTAGDLASRDIANQLQVAGANQAAQNAARQFGAGNRQTMFAANQAARNTARGMGAQFGQQTSLANQAARNAAGQFGAANFQQRQLANQEALNRAAEFNAMQKEGNYDRYFENLMSNIDRLGNLSQASYSLGSDIDKRQMQAGEMVRNLQNAILQGGQNMFSEYVSQPEQLLQLRLASVGMNPLTKATSTSTTQSQGTGMGDIFGALLGTAGNMFQLNPITFGGG